MGARNETSGRAGTGAFHMAASLAVELDCLAAQTLPELTPACDVIFTVVTTDDFRK